MPTELEVELLRIQKKREANRRQYLARKAAGIRYESNSKYRYNRKTEPLTDEQKAERALEKRHQQQQEKLLLAPEETVKTSKRGRPRKVNEVNI